VAGCCREERSGRVLPIDEERRGRVLPIEERQGIAERCQVGCCRERRGEERRGEEESLIRYNEA